MHISKEHPIKTEDSSETISEEENHYALDSETNTRKGKGKYEPNDFVIETESGFVFKESMFD